MSDGVMGDRMREVGREYHAILTLQWRAFPSGFHITTVESTLTFGSAVTRRDVFEDMQERAVASAVESGCAAAKTGSGSVLFFTCEPNTL